MLAFVPVGNEDMPPEGSLGDIGVVNPPLEGVLGQQVPTRAMANLLEILPIQQQEGGKQQSGAYVGDGLPPVPAKLAAKILKWEFDQMHDLLPEFWVGDKESEGSSKAGSSRGKGKKRLKDVQVWLQCFAQYVSVLSSKFPEAVPELMAYMVGIIKASIEFEEGAWMAYDTAYRRQAAATGHRLWSKLNPSLYTLCFTGKAKRVARCELCLGSSHTAEECALASEDDPDISKRRKAVESAVVAFSGKGQSGKASKATDLCRLFQQNRCTFQNCKYRHSCKRCGGAHPGMECQRPVGSQGQGPAAPGPVRREPELRSRGRGNPY